MITDLTLVATTPLAMQQAQVGLIQWCGKRLARADNEIAEVEENLEIATRRKWAVKPWRRQISRIRKHRLFIEKLQAALEAGYYIIPDMPFTEVFAIRTKRAFPLRKQVTGRWPSLPLEPAMALPTGEGEYKSPNQLVHSSIEKDDKGNKQTTLVAANFDEIEFPVHAAKPQILEAAERAMKLRIFDEIGVVPRRGCGDPFLVGRLKNPKRPHSPTTLFLGWWLDVNDFG